MDKCGLGTSWLLGWRASRSSGVSRAKVKIGPKPKRSADVRRTPNYGGQPSPDWTNAMFVLVGF
jgi:hypothetical protein